MLKRKQVGSFNWSAKKKQENEYVSSEDEKDDIENTSSESEQEEDAQDVKLRLAKDYLAKLENLYKDEKVKASPDGITGIAKDKIGMELAKEAMESKGRTFYVLSEQLEDVAFDEDSRYCYRGLKSSVCGIALSKDGCVAITTGKNGEIVKWDVKSGRRLVCVNDFQEEMEKEKKTDKDRCVLGVAISPDEKYFVTGEMSGKIRVWDNEKNTVLETFKGHRDGVTSLVFRKQSSMLFSGSLDRSIKHWNLKEMGYVETLYGHQCPVNALDSLMNEKVVSCSGDHSVRLWKVADETQLVFHGQMLGSMDCIKMVNEQYYVTGSDTGALVLWFDGRKKPAVVVEDAHGKGNWICSLAVMRGTDVIASGSYDGFVRFWKVDLKMRSLTMVAQVPVPGFVNAMEFDANRRFLIAGTGREHRLGRWMKTKGGKNGIAIVALPEFQM